MERKDILFVPMDALMDILQNLTFLLYLWIIVDITETGFWT